MNCRIAAGAGLQVDAIKTFLRRARADGRAVGAINLLTSLHQNAKDARDWLKRGQVRAALAGQRPREPEALVELAMNAAGGFLRPMQQPAEIAELVRVVRERSPRHVLEIGTARGGTLFLLCESAADDAHLVSLDLPRGRNGGGYPAWKAPIYESFARGQRQITLVRANSHDPASRDAVARHAGPQGFDLIMIDADHSYAGVKTDFELYAPLLAPGGMIVMHDILPNRFDAEIDVAPFWAEVKARYPNTREIVADPEQGVFGIGLVFP
jgi:predicted O-methyltransferase YrrM